jgi:arylsulfatase A-like enzyme
MKKPLRALSLLCLLALAALLAWWAWGALRPPDNVVVVVIDTLRRDHLATYGYARQTAPFLDRLAREGAVFDGLSPTSWTKPATASLLTGLHPLRHQAVGRLDSLPEQVTTLAERLREKGYKTLGISANGWISNAFGFGQGFDELMMQDSLGHAEEVNQMLLPRLDRLRPPFFLYVHYIDPHAPYEPRTAWDGGALRDPAPVTIESLDPFTVRQRPAEMMARVRDLYDGEIHGADRGLEQLVGELERRGLMENTLLIVTSDHGEELEDHGRMSHGLSLYEEVVRVPLVLYGPHRIPAGRHGIASLLDVVPTLEDLLHLGATQGGLDGESQAASLSGRETAAGRRPFLFHLDHMDGTGLALTRGRDKIVLGRRPYRKELFDLAADPGERHNRFQRSGEKAFTEIAADLARMYNEHSLLALPRRPAVLDEGLQGQLAALGYAAPGRTGDPRRIPRRIVTADTAPRGLLGWEGIESLPSCATLAAPESERHLLYGWHAPEPRGRWSKQEGVILLGVPAGTSRSTLVLKGASYRPDTPRVTVRLEGRPLLESAVAPGAVHLSAPVDLLPASRAVTIEIATDSAFIPSEHGGSDPRQLGLFLFSVCLQPASGAAGRPTAAP